MNQIMDTKPVVKILIIEDSKSETAKIKNLLANSEIGKFEIEQEEELVPGLARLVKGGIDVVLLDLNLPDSYGIDTLIRVRTEALAYPIIVLSSIDKPEIAIESMRKGAQDYLVKSKTDCRLLAHSIRYSIERHRLQMKLQMHSISRIEELKNDIKSLEKLRHASPTTLTSELSGINTLKDGTPDSFDELAKQYGNLIELAVDQRLFKVKHNISDGLHEIADRIGFLRGGPRDVIEIHNTIMKNVCQTDTPQKIKLYSEEGRLMILELIGNLALYYRKYSMGLSRKG